jgi:hypothetical protein
MALVSQLNRTGYSIPAVLSLLTLLTSVIGKLILQVCLVAHSLYYYKVPSLVYLVKAKPTN